MWEFFYFRAKLPNMKYIVLLAISLSLSACYVKKAPTVQIGMSEEAFKAEAKNEELVEMNQYATIYKVRYGLNNYYLPKFYYFVNGKLVEVNEGETPLKRYQVEVKTTD